MAISNRSLRELVEKWLSPTSSRLVRVKEFKNRHAEHQCYVCVEVQMSTGLEPLAMFFFRHRDGAWRVFPPSRERPAMSFSPSMAEATF